MSPHSVHHTQASQCKHRRSWVSYTKAIVIIQTIHSLQIIRSITSSKQYHPLAHTEASHLSLMLAMAMTASILRSGIASTSGRTGHEGVQSFGSFCATCPPLRAPSAHSWAAPTHATSLLYTSSEAQKTQRWRDRGKPTSLTAVIFCSCCFAQQKLILSSSPQAECVCMQRPQQILVRAWSLQMRMWRRC